MLRHNGLFIFVLSIFVARGAAQRLRQPERVRIPSRTPTSVTLTWEQPPGIRYPSFNVLVRPPSASVEEPRDPGIQRRTITNLTPGTRYVVSIIGVTEGGRQSPPNTYELFSEPLPPTNLTLKALNQIEIVYEVANIQGIYTIETVGVEIDWEPSDTTSSLSGYNVQISPRGGTETFPRPLAGAQPDLTSRIFIGLIPGEEYTFTVRSQIGPPYSLVYSRPISQVIRIPPAQPFSVEVTEVGTTTASIQTLGPLVGIYDQLFLSLSPSHGRISSPMPDPNRETHDIYALSGLIPGTRYVLDVYSVSVGVRNENPVQIVFFTSPLEPTPVKVEDYTSTTMTLSWLPPAGASGNENVIYLVDIQDIDDPEAEIRTERVYPNPEEPRIETTLRDLIPGAIYRFSVSTETNGVKSEGQTIVEHATVPPKPTLGLMEAAEDGVLLRIERPESGRCPNLMVFYSPPLPGEERVEPQSHKINTNIVIPGLPSDERYTIYVRCVALNIEGPALMISSRARFDSRSGTFNDDPNQPRRRLPCIRAGAGNRPTPRIVDQVPPDGCCGMRPFRGLSQTCCSGVIHSTSEGHLCCGRDYYQTSNQFCCPDITVADNEELCN